MDTPRCFEKTGMRGHKSFSGVGSADTTVSRGTVFTETSTRHRCLVQLQAVTSNRNAVSCERFGLDDSPTVIRTASPPPRYLRLSS